MAWQIPCTKEFCCKKHYTNFFYFLTVVIWSNMKQCEARVKKFIYSELSHHIILSFAFFAAIPVEKPFCMAHHAHELSRLYRWSLSRSHHIASRNNVPLPPSVNATFPLSILLVFLTSSTLAIHTLQWREALGILGKMSWPRPKELGFSFRNLFVRATRLSTIKGEVGEGGVRAESRRATRQH